MAETKASLRVFEKCGSGKDTEKQQFPMEAETENMQSGNNDVKTRFLMHIEEGNTGQQKKP